MTIKFNKYNVTNGTDKARIRYSINGRTDGRDCVTLYAQDMINKLHKIFSIEYHNNTDTHQDYFDQGRVVLFADHPLYAKALERAK
jgi:hypothetical protein